MRERPVERNDQQRPEEQRIADRPQLRHRGDRASRHRRSGASAKKPGRGSALAMPTHFWSSAARDAQNRQRIGDDEERDAPEAGRRCTRTRRKRRHDCAVRGVSALAPRDQPERHEREREDCRAGEQRCRRRKSARESMRQDERAGEPGQRPDEHARESLPQRGNAPTGGSARGNEINAANSTQLKITSG